ncbi:NUDIX hydrolase [Haloechinothrix sp. LS1_15]|nr:NUDIX hydrolase [Haloechinothrix sp. LS1_15]
MHAAGAVLWRSDGSGNVRLAVVHRPRYDDWSLPKGKLDPAETAPAAAVREVREETGSDCVLDRHVSTIRYQVATGDGDRTVPKTVRYYSARATGGDFLANSEVDQLRWMAPSEAYQTLTYDTERAVLDEFTRIPPGSPKLLLVRHAKAGKREHWDGDDDLRPLSEAGLRQADALSRLLPLFGPEQVHSAPRLRCVQTVRGVATELGIDVVHEPLLTEEGYTEDPDKTLHRLLELVAGSRTPLVCSQGGVIPGVVHTLAEHGDLPLRSAPSKKGSLWVLTFSHDPNGSGHVLRDADYFPNPLPSPRR